MQWLSAITIGVSRVVSIDGQKVLPAASGRFDVVLHTGTIVFFHLDRQALRSPPHISSKV
jgi:hypothetical protein